MNKPNLIKNILENHRKFEFNDSSYFNEDTLASKVDLKKLCFQVAEKGNNKMASEYSNIVCMEGIDLFYTQNTRLVVTCTCLVHFRLDDYKME